MEQAVRVTRERFGNREVTVKLRDLHHPDYQKEVEFIDTEEDETWVYGITHSETAEFLRCSDNPDLLDEPEPPEWVREGFEMWGIEVAE